MRVLLRQSQDRFYYAGPTRWVNGSKRARDLKTVERAIEVARNEGFGSMEIVAWLDRPGCELVFPIQFNGKSHEEGSSSTLHSPSA